MGEVSLSMTREMNEETGLSRRNFASAFVAMATSGSFLLGRPQEASAYESCTYRSSLYGILKSLA